MVVSDFSAQVFPQELNQVEPGRVGREGKEHELIGILFEELFGFLAVMNDEVVDHQNDFLSVIVWRMSDRLHELLYEGAKSDAVLVFFDAVQSMTRHVIDRSEAITLLVDARRHHFALGTPQGPTAQDARQEVEIDFILKVQQDFSFFCLFFVLFQASGLAWVSSIRAGDREHRSQYPVSESPQMNSDGLAAHLLKALPGQLIRQLRTGPG